jgi:hypothetical protein
MSPHKRANPLGWPFGTLPARELARLKREQQKQQPAPQEAPF